MSKLWLVTKHTYRKNVFTPAFFFMVLGPIFFLAFFAFIGFIAGSISSGNNEGELAMVGGNPALVETFEAHKGKISLETGWSEEKAQAALKNKDIAGYFKVTEDKDQVKSIDYITTATSDDINLSAFKTATENYEEKRKAQQLGISDKEFQTLKTSNLDINQINLKENEQGELVATSRQSPEVFAKKAVAYTVSILVFFFIMQYVSVISQEIAGEKGSRIMEIILSSIPANTHFFGKILGVCLMILTQMACYVVLGLVLNIGIQQFNLLGPVLHDLETSLDFSIGSIVHAILPTIGMGIIYALLGFVMFVALAGLLGSLASKIEDIQKSVLPVTLSGVIGFYIGIFALGAPNNNLVRFGSFFPLFTPFVMPFRLAADTVAPWELGLSVVLMLLFAALTFYLATQFYRTNVLTYSNEGMWPTFKRSLSLWKSEH